MILGGRLSISVLLGHIGCIVVLAVVVGQRPVGDQQMDQPNSVIRLKLLSVIRKSKEGVKGLALNGTNPVPPCFGTPSADPSNLLIA